MRRTSLSSEKDVKFILDTLVNSKYLTRFTFVSTPLTAYAGLSRLEYRGYDSASLAVDGNKRNEVFAFKEVGKVAKLKELIETGRLGKTSDEGSH
ncbi:uncharacterized protein K452DRAFT_235198 [Aplosporella prunicola CBS 121167]|uniref:Uncharacterized protein n=1 Tax=Aplosporella prunicola CBS 121167 TaxID=1176127 RepID=A0A6A6B547_9PEZI|nr:uncharacterized protein K452DRAFT_235198 [Aplosporella prunicola CBS 121167]KAF2137871.1 hypothetical protein K452DRAFT_235198 [Aplosporella prunicola CBS 121167]